MVVGISKVVLEVLWHEPMNLTDCSERVLAQIEFAKVVQKVKCFTTYIAELIEWVVVYGGI